jgi:hypothetical protein
MNAEDRMEDASLPGQDVSTHQKTVLAQVVNVYRGLYRFLPFHIKQHGKTLGLASVLIHNRGL